MKTLANCWNVCWFLMVLGFHSNSCRRSRLSSVYRSYLTLRRSLNLHFTMKGLPYHPHVCCFLCTYKHIHWLKSVSYHYICTFHFHLSCLNSFSPVRFSVAIVRFIDHPFLGGLVFFHFWPWFMAIEPIEPSSTLQCGKFCSKTAIRTTAPKKDTGKPFYSKPQCR